MTDETTGAAPAAAAVTDAAVNITSAMAATPPAIKTAFERLISEIDAIPSNVTAEIGEAKTKILAAIIWVESHFTTAKAAAETDVASIKTDAGEVQAAVEKAV
jgi:hypothetical protein